MSVIDKLATFKTKRVKGNSQEQFDGEVLESIALRDKLFKKFKSSKLNAGKESIQIKKFIIKHATNCIG